MIFFPFQVPSCERKILECILIVAHSRNGAFIKIVSQVKGKENPQHFLGVSPGQNVSRNIRICPMIQINNVNKALQELASFYDYSLSVT